MAFLGLKTITSLLIIWWVTGWRKFFFYAIVTANDDILQPVDFKEKSRVC
jgi:hypothetical protein